MAELAVKSYHTRVWERVFVVVGCGGTGSILAEGLANMVAGYKKNARMVLVDHDLVEEKNVFRQNFMPSEIGQNKAEALAFRLNLRFGLDIGALAQEVTKKPANDAAIYITAVHTVTPRKLFKDSRFWLDLGNDKSTGQAIFGTTSNASLLKQEAKNWNKQPYVMSLPNAYYRAGMEKLKDELDVPNCADNPYEEQGPLVNRMAAMAGLAILKQILVEGQVRTPSVYFDADCATMAPCRITKEYLVK